MVAPPVEVDLSCSLLRAHVRRGSYHHPGLRDRLRSGGTYSFGDSEVHHHGFAFVQHDVLGLYVSMHYPLTVRVVQRRCYCSTMVHCLFDRKLALAVEPLAQ